MPGPRHSLWHNTVLPFVLPVGARRIAVRPWARRIAVRPWARNSLARAQGISPAQRLTHPHHGAPQRVPPAPRPQGGPAPLTSSPWPKRSPSATKRSTRSSPSASSSHASKTSRSRRRSSRAGPPGSIAAQRPQPRPRSAAAAIRRRRRLPAGRLPPRRDVSAGRAQPGVRRPLIGCVGSDWQVCGGGCDWRGCGGLNGWVCVLEDLIGRCVSVGLWQVCGGAVFDRGLGAGL